MKKFILTLLVVFGFCSVAHAVVYSPRTNFSPTNNPNGVWSYGYSTSLGGMMTLYPNHVVNPDGFYAWEVSSNWIKIPHVTLIDKPLPWGFVPDSDELGFHPGRYGECSIIRWTAPSDGTSTITNDFRNAGGGVMQVYVYHNANKLFDAVLPNMGAASPIYNSTLSVHAGDKIDYVVRAIQQYGDGCTTLVAATINFTPVNSWKGPGGGSYDLASNWSENIVPNGVNETANFFGNITAISQITLNSNITLGTINFNSPIRYILRGTPSLMLQSSSGQARINMQNGSHFINNPVVLQSDTIISGAGTLALNGGISGNHTLSVLSNITATSIQVDILSIGSVGAAQAVPELSTIALLGMGALSLIYVWRRRSGSR